MITKNSRVLITGCGGMLGEGVYKRFKDAAKVYATDKDVNEPWLTYLDVTDTSQVEATLSEVHPDYIVHLAALTDMEYCEAHPEEAYATNSQGVKNFLPYVEEHNIPFAYISTAGIFDGKKDIYDENDTPNPLSVYGKSKYEGELAARTVPKHVVARAGWMTGGGPLKDKKFFNKIVMQLKAGAKDLYVVEDKLGTPCYTYDLANIIFTLLDKELYGVFHAVCDGGGSRFDVAKLMLEVFGYSEKVQLHQVESDYFKNTYFAPRPHSEKLKNLHLAQVGLALTHDWKECLRDYAQKFDWGL